MRSPLRKRTLGAQLLRACVLVAVVAGLLVTTAPVTTPPAAAQGAEPLEVWGISGGIVNNPKEWKFRQSFEGQSGNLGTVAAADPALDDSAWATRTLRWKEFPGPEVANHFRKDFTLAEIGVQPFQVVGIRVSLQYDDTAVLYLNGQEVYRSIRGNLDPDYLVYPESGAGTSGNDIPYDAYVAFGGQENFYVDIPNINGTNTCENNPTCTNSPYTPTTDPPEIPLSLLEPGVNDVNTWAITTWNQSGGGSGDSSLNHTFELLIDDEALPPNPIFINEVVASNDFSWLVDTDGDPNLESPDWFELINVSTEAVDMAGWTVSDASASWVFPSVTIPAGGYLAVAANDANRTDTTPLQTNFKLSTNADMLRLTNPAGFVADEYILNDQFTDTSYGRPNDTGEPTYLQPFIAPDYTPGLTPTSGPTPGEANRGAGTNFSPILRPFSDRWYNEGEPVSHQIRAFDPDGSPITFDMSPMPAGLSMTADGLITGTATSTTTSTISISDGGGPPTTQDVDWNVVPTPTKPAPLVLNEYNAVPADRELLTGGVIGNGGDWFEFLVIEDEVNLQGYTIELRDNKGPDDNVRDASSVTFGNEPEFARVPAGTIITISEDNPDDFSFDADTDWHINLQISNLAAGTYFELPEVGEVFNSTRAGQTVLIKDASGTVVTALSGETEAWDAANGGVSGSEVMNLCANPSLAATPNPVADYRDTGTSSTFGLPNTCEFPDPANPAVTIAFNQDLSALRATATLGAGSGDANCDGVMNTIDALFVAQLSAVLRSDSGPCFFNNGGPSFDVYAAGGDITGDGTTDIIDALIIARCEAQLPSQYCPDA